MARVPPMAPPGRPSTVVGARPPFLDHDAGICRARSSRGFRNRTVTVLQLAMTAQIGIAVFTFLPSLALPLPVSVAGVHAGFLPQ